MHPHQLARAVTDVAYNGTPVTQFYAVLELDEEIIEGLIWAFDEKAALKIARKKWPNGKISLQPRK